MQCPKLQTMRNEMMDTVGSIPDGSRVALLESQCNLVLILLGKYAEGYSLEQMVIIWAIASKYISMMYNYRVKEGIE